MYYRNDIELYLVNLYEHFDVLTVHEAKKKNKNKNFLTLFLARERKTLAK